MTIGSGGNPTNRGPGYIPINKWGGNVDIDTADALLGQIIWPVKSTVQPYAFIDTPILLTLQSSDAADAIAGTGAQTVHIMYQDASGHIQSVVLDMVSGGSVDLPETSVGSFRMSVASSGSGNTNAGQITLENGGTIYSTIEAGEGQSQIAIIRCPNDKKGNVEHHIIGYGRTGNTNEANMRLKVRKPDGTIITKWDPIVSTLSPEDIKEYHIGGLTLNPGEWLYWEAISVSANNTPIRGSFDIEFEDL